MQLSLPIAEKRWCSLHQLPVGQSVSVRQPLMHSPVVVLQMLPVWPAQSALVMHMPHSPMFVPERKQKGWLGPSSHASEVPEPMSPLQGTQVEEVVSQTGVMPEHIAEEVHCTQVLVVVLQVGAELGHCESIRQATQLPALVPEVAQMFDRHTVSPLLSVHGPSPLA